MPTRLRPQSTHRIRCSICERVWYEGTRVQKGPDHWGMQWTPVNHQRKEIISDCPRCQGSLIQE